MDTHIKGSQKISREGFQDGINRSALVCEDDGAVETVSVRPFVLLQAQTR